MTMMLSNRTQKKKKTNEQKTPNKTNEIRGNIIWLEQ